MKLHQYTFVTIIIIWIFNNNCLSQTYTSTTVYTPNGTAVSAGILTSSDFDEEYKEEYLDWFLDSYPYAVYYGEATLTYNCHAYAWVGSTVWIWTPDDDTFWEDCSYTEVEQQQDAKVSYGDGVSSAGWSDHSAIMQAGEDYVISKWGDGPLFGHDIYDCPFAPDDLRYYTLSLDPYVTGPEYACYAGTDFTANRLPPDATVHWTTSTNLDIKEGEYEETAKIGTDSPSYTGTEWIQANITCNSYTPWQVKEYKMANPPYYTDIELRVRDASTWEVVEGDGYWELDPYTTYEMDVVDVEMYGCSISDYDYTLPQGFSVISEYGNYIDFNTSSSEGGIVTLDATTCCGEREVFTGYLVTEGELRLVFNPNPTTGETTISITTRDNKEVVPDTQWYLEIYGTMLNLKEAKSNIKEPSIKVNVSGWNRGVYLVKGVIGDKLAYGKLIVN